MSSSAVQKFTAVAVATFVLGIAVGAALFGAAFDGRASAQPKCPGPSANCTPTPMITATATPTTTPTTTPTPAAFHSYIVTANGQFGAIAYCDEGDPVSGGGYDAGFVTNAAVWRNAPSVSSNGLQGWSASWNTGYDTGLNVHAICVDNPPLRSSP